MKIYTFRSPNGNIRLELPDAWPDLEVQQLIQWIASGLLYKSILSGNETGMILDSNDTIRTIGTKLEPGEYALLVLT